MERGGGDVPDCCKREHGSWSVRREMSWNVEEVMCLTVVKGNMAAGVLEGKCYGTWRR